MFYLRNPKSVQGLNRPFHEVTRELRREVVYKTIDRWQGSELARLVDVNQVPSSGIRDAPVRPTYMRRHVSM